MNLSMLLSKSARLFPDKPAIIHGDRLLAFSNY
jgi:hypothetical protein